MNYAELKDLHALATKARDSAHRAYTVALQNRRTEGDTEYAWATLLKTNQVRDAIYSALLEKAGQ